MTTAEPRSLASALHSAGLEPLQVLDDDAAIAAVSGEGVRFDVAVVPAEAVGARELRVRAAALAALHHEHLGRTGPVLDLGDGRWALLRQEVPGVPVSAVRGARGPWTPGEVVTLLVPLAEALGVLHGAGLTHGRVTDEAVLLGSDGRPVLTAACPAPGQDLPVVTPLGDLADLGRLGLELIDAADADVVHVVRGGAWVAEVRSGPVEAYDEVGAPDEVEVPDADGVPDEGVSGEGPDVQRADLVDLLVRAVDGAPDRHGRPPEAGRLAQALLDAAAPEPIRVPVVATPPAAVLRAGAVRQDGYTQARVRARHRAGSRAGPPGPAGATSAPGTGRGLRVELLGVPTGPRPRSRRRWTGLRAPVAVVALACTAALVWAVAGGSRPTASDASPAEDLAAVALELTAMRARALASGDRGLLTAVSVPGSPAALADRVAADRLGDLGPSRVEVDLLAARVLQQGPDEARVLVTSRVAAEQDDEPVQGDAVGARSVVLVLRATDGGWAVHDVEEHRP